MKYPVCLFRLFTKMSKIERRYYLPKHLKYRKLFENVKISHVIISFANFLTYLPYYMTPRFWKFQTSSKKMCLISSISPKFNKKACIKSRLPGFEE